MNFVVIPLSAIGFKPPKFDLLWLISVAVHLFAFGVPISLAAALPDDRTSRTNTLSNALQNAKRRPIGPPFSTLGVQ